MSGAYLGDELEALIRSDPAIFTFLEQGSLDGVWYLNIENPVDEWYSPAFCKLFGYEYGEIPHTSAWWQENIHAEDLPTAIANFKAHLRDPDHPYDQVARYRHKLGHTVWVRCRGIAIRNEDGKPIRMLGAHNDLTELMNQRRAFEELAESLSRSNEDLEQFAYAASHDLQEPLRAVSNYASMLEDEYRGQLSDEADLYIRYIVDSTSRMHSMLEGLLAFSRVGRHETFDALPSANPLDDAIVNLDARISESGAVITKGSMPEVWGDRAMLTRLFQNLIANAIKFRKSEDDPPVIHISAEDRGQGYWTFSIRDNGIGLDMDHAAKIFVIFHRLVKNRNGTGIGLSICKKIVERHGGRIWVESRPDHGATFYFTLRKPDALAEPPSHEAIDLDGRGQPTGRSDDAEGVGEDYDGPVGCGGPRWSRSPSLPPGSAPVLLLEAARSRPARHEPAPSEWPRSAGGGG